MSHQMICEIKVRYTSFFLFHHSLSIQWRGGHSLFQQHGLLSAVEVHTDFLHLNPMQDRTTNDYKRALQVYIIDYYTMIKNRSK
jgi:hypothetical protein